MEQYPVQKEFPGLSQEYCESLPVWDRECRAPTSEEFRDYCRNRPRSCKEYEPAWPLAQYHGKCKWFIHFGNRPCGMSFVKKSVCLFGVAEEGRSVHVGWLSFRKTRDRLGRTDESRAEAIKQSQSCVPKSKERVVRKVQTGEVVKTVRGPHGVITYTCEVCNTAFESKRSRNGPKICAKCIGWLRKEGKGPVQSKRERRQVG